MEDSHNERFFWETEALIMTKHDCILTQIAWGYLKPCVPINAVHRWTLHLDAEEPFPMPAAVPDTAWYNPAEATNIVTSCAIFQNISIHCNFPEPLFRLDDWDYGCSYSEDERTPTGVSSSLRNKGHEVRLRRWRNLLRDIGTSKSLRTH